MKFKLYLISIFALIVLTACGQGSSTSSDARAKQANFVGSQTIVLNSEGNTASEVDDFVLKLEGNIVTIIDEDFSATGQLGLDNQFSLSSPMFSTSSDGVTCTGNVNYSGIINGESVSGSIRGEFNCSSVTFDVSGNFSGSR